MSEPTDLIAPSAEAVEIALQQSRCSPCRSKRGAVIYREYRGAQTVAILGRGHNNKVGAACDGSEGCKSTCRIEAVHAEQRALLNAGPHAKGADILHVKTVDGVLVASGGPSCVECSKLISAAGIAAVWLFHADGWKRYSIAEFHQLSLDALRAQRTEGRPIESYRVESDSESGDWHILTFADGKQTRILTRHPLVIVEPETH